MRPERVLADVRKALPADGFIVTDVGWNKNGVGQQFGIQTPGTMIAPGGMATMGFGHAAVLGVKMAQPQRAAVALIGDGCFSSNMSVLATAVEADVPVVWVVMDNASYGVISGIEKRHLGNTHGCMFEANGEPYFIDYAAVANACGARRRQDRAGRPARRRAEGGAGLRQADADPGAGAARADAHHRPLGHQRHLQEGGLSMADTASLPTYGNYIAGVEARPPRATTSRPTIRTPTSPGRGSPAATPTT